MLVAVAVGSVGVAAATAVGPATSAAAYGPNGVTESDETGSVWATVPTASAGPVGPKAAKATTDSAPNARPARRCITLEGLPRLTRSAFR